MAARLTAGLFVERRDIAPPIDVQGLIEEQVDLHRVDWPHERVDAVCVGLGQSGVRPTVFIRATDNLLRERFTMAHELGHLVLPWHLPSPNCQIDDNEFEFHSGTTEQQADIFASCLLVPDRWIADLVTAHREDMSQIIREMNTAEVTTAAALQALRRYLLPGWVFVAYGGDSVVATRGTVVPTSGSGFRSRLEERSFGHGAASLNGHELRWYKLSASASLPTKQFGDERSDHQILLDAIEHCQTDFDREARGIAASANGKVGGTLREAAGRDASETYEAMIHRLEGWEYAALLGDDDFLLWLAQRSRAIEAGETKRKR